MMTYTDSAALRPGGPLLAALAVAAGTTAYADPVRFENDGSFDWGDNLFLDITKGVSKQVGAFPGPGTFLYYRTLSTCCAPSENFRVRGGLTTAQLEGYPTVSVRNAGALFPDDVGSDWYNSRLLGYYYSAGLGFYTQFDKTYPTDPGYMAARFDIDGATHYGWMSLRTRQYPGPTPNRFFFLLAWGYETEPNTPIEAGAVPSPSGALALLAFGAAAGATRARRH